MPDEVRRMNNFLRRFQSIKIASSVDAFAGFGVYRDKFGIASFRPVAGTSADKF
jgi:hypothetical protein